MRGSFMLNSFQQWFSFALMSCQIREIKESQLVIFLCKIYMNRNSKHMPQASRNVNIKQDIKDCFWFVLLKLD